jgi:AAA+ superfamily predicted ATPase
VIMDKSQQFIKLLEDYYVPEPTVLKSSEGSPSKKKQVLIQYMAGENSFHPVGQIKTVKTLPPGIYNIQDSVQGPYFEITDIRTDNLLKFADSRYNMILEEIDQFWGDKEKFNSMGFLHKRGILLYGNPGTGKSCLLKQVMEGTIERGDLVFMAGTSSYRIREGLAQLKEVEPDRQVLAVMEDIDEFDEHTLLQLFDGNTIFDDVLFLGTTNYIQKLQPRLLREGRFDRKIRIDNPPLEGRVAYLNYKLGKREPSEKIREMAEKTKGFSFGQLREFLVSVYCLGYNVDETVKRIQSGREEFTMTEAELDHKLIKSKVFLEQNIKKAKLKFGLNS